MTRNMTVATYSSGSKWLHWLIAIVVITMLSFSFFLGDVPDKYQSLAYMIHKSLGLCVLFLMILRFIWINYSGKPALPASVSTWEKRVSRLVQYSFYLLLIAMPVCGWIMSVAAGRAPTFFGLFSMPLPIAKNKPLAELMELSHKTIAWLLIALIILHVAGALKHHFIDKNNILKQMLTGN